MAITKVTTDLINTLDASKLTGTIADARFPATLPAISGANLTGVGVTGITSSANATAITISADEEVSMPLQPCFNGNNGTQTNITGDNTDAVILCTEVFDQAGNYATHNTFTAPITGKYILCGHVGWAGVLYGTADHVQIKIETSNRNYMLYREFANEILQEDGMSISVVADLDASDTAQLKWKVGGMAKNADQRNGYIGFSGCLIA